MINFTPVPIQFATPEGEMLIYQQMKTLCEWTWDCLTCKLPWCSDENYEDLVEEEENEQQQPSLQILSAQTEPIHIDSAVNSAKKSMQDSFNTEEEEKSHLGTQDTLSENEVQKTTSTSKARNFSEELHFNDLELTSLNSLNSLPINSFPKGEFFVLASSNCKLLAKIREVKLNIPYTFIANEEVWIRDDKENNSRSKDPNFKALKDNQTLQQIYDERYWIFSEYRKGIKLAEDDWLTETPEIIAQHVAKRLGDKFNTVLDAFSGAGSNSIQLAQQCDRVYVAGASKQLINNIRGNAKIYKVADKIDFTHKDLLDSGDMKKPGAVFINLGIRDSGHAFSLRKDDARPSLEKILDRVFQISENFALLLPSKTKLEELVEILSTEIEKHESISRRSIVEIEQIKVNDSDSGLLVLYGDSSSVSKADELRAISSVFKQIDSQSLDIKSIADTEGLWKAFKHCANQSTIDAKNQTID